MQPAPAAHLAPGRVRVFGRVLATDSPLPGLPVADPGDGQFPFWELRTTRSDVAIVDHDPSATIIGRHAYSNGVEVTLATGAGGAEILVTDTGRFTLSDDGRRIAHLSPSTVDRSAVALDLIGVVLPYALHRDGDWCMHASAVVMRDGVVAFVAPRGTGKSTLATACLQAGCALVADDVVVLRHAAHGVTVTPTGLPIRLRAETAHAVGVASSTADEWGKVRVVADVVTEALPLAAVYVLAPMVHDAEVVRAPRTTRAAALALLSNGKITELLGADAAGDALTRCIDIAQATTVFDLAVPRELSRLGAVTDMLLQWHGRPPVNAGMSA